MSTSPVFIVSTSPIRKIANLSKPINAGSILILELNYAVDVVGLLATNPFNSVATPKGASATPDLWNKDELNEFEKVSSEHRLGFYFRLSAYTGARKPF